MPNLADFYNTLNKSYHSLAYVIKRNKHNEIKMVSKVGFTFMDFTLNT